LGQIFAAAQPASPRARSSAVRGCTPRSEAESDKLSRVRPDSAGSNPIED
jgi:hypothetical protein